MLTVREHLTAIGSANLDAALRYVTTSLGTTARLLQLQHNAAQKLLADNAESLRALTVGRSSNDDFFSRWPQLYFGNVQTLFGVTRECVEIASLSQAELVRLMSEQAATVNKSVTDAVGSFVARAVPAAAQQSPQPAAVAKSRKAA